MSLLLLFPSSAAGTPAGVRSLFAFWMGGASMVAAAGGGKPWLYYAQQRAR